MDGIDTDALGRMPITDAMKSDMTGLLNGIEPGKRGALLVVADTNTMTVRTQVAAKLGDDWKVAAGVGFDIRNITKVPNAQVMLVGSW